MPLSTNANNQYLLENFAPVETGSDGKKYRDFDSHKLYELIRSLNLYLGYDWSDEEQITSLSYNIYGNTTEFWMIQFYNGFLDSLELTGGAFLKLPIPQEIEVALKKFEITNEIGQTVLI